MRRTNLLLGAAAALAMTVGLSGAANAATLLLTPGTTIEAGTFGDLVAGNFTDTLTFTTGGFGYFAADVTNNTTLSAWHKMGDVDFTSFTLTGTGTITDYTHSVDNLENLVAGKYLKSVGTLNATLTKGTYTIHIAGHSYAAGPVPGKASSYSGTTTWDAAAIPEPASWALMTIGFGGLGAMIRRRRSAMAFA